MTTPITPEQGWEERFKIAFKEATDDWGFPNVQVIRIRLESFMAAELARERNRVVDYLIANCSAIPKRPGEWGKTIGIMISNERLESARSHEKE